jgi:tetratricopeptide (TPR) repeat protein
LNPTQHILELADRARAAERAGQNAESEALWRALANAWPRHPGVLLRQAKARLSSDPRGGAELLREALAGDGTDPEIPMTLALALRLMGDIPGAIGALDVAIVIDPKHFVALLTKGSLLEAMGERRQAARIYRTGLAYGPPAEMLPPHLRALAEQARWLVAANAREIADHLRARTAELKASLGAEPQDRFEECLEILAGTKRAFVHQPALLNFPQLPAIQFFDPDHFPWFQELEAATPIFVEELQTILQADWDRFQPYIQYPPGTPVNQWVQLNHSPDWSTFFFWRDGRRYDENCARCPRSAAVLTSLPLAEQPGFAPSAMFSVLQPHTHIPAHCGSANTRAIVHLPLILPSNCRFRVGNTMREWKMGEAFAFDDTIEHEAWNDSDQVRVVLIFDVWNPLLTETERTLVTAMMTAYADYVGGETFET